MVVGDQVYNVTNYGELAWELFAPLPYVTMHR